MSISKDEKENNNEEGMIDKINEYNESQNEILDEINAHESQLTVKSNKSSKSIVSNGIGIDKMDLNSSVYKYTMGEADWYTKEENEFADTKGLVNKSLETNNSNNNNNSNKDKEKKKVDWSKVEYEWEKPGYKPKMDTRGYGYKPKKTEDFL